jgi:peptidoglycan/LPS O-acetylase OafA/YrhL
MMRLPWFTIASGCGFSSIIMFCKAKMPNPVEVVHEEERRAEVLPAEKEGAGERTHILALDGLRGLAILGVMLFHFLPYTHPTGEANPLIRYGLLAIHVGQTGVDLFFVLSGFLITGILLDTKKRPGYFSNFYARRTLRIFPLYYGVLLVLLVLTIATSSQQGLEGQLMEQAWVWLYLTNIAQFVGAAIPAHTGHFWSLAVEEHFYAVWPAVVRFCNAKRLAILCVVMVIAAIGLRYILASHGLDAFFLTPCRMDVLAIGGLLAILASKDGLRRLTPYAKWSIAGIVILLVPLYLFKTGTSDILVQTAKHTLLAAMYGCLLVAAVGATEGGLVARFFTNRFLRFFGKYSYGLYVYHGLLGGVFLSWFPITQSDYVVPFVASALARVAGATIISVTIAWVSWHLYENPFLRLKRYFSYHK